MKRVLAACAAGFLSITLSCLQQDFNDVILKSGTIRPNWEVRAEDKEISCASLERIIQNNNKSHTPKERRLAVIENLASIVYLDKDGLVLMNASALMVSKGGYFFTTGHAAEPVLTGYVGEKPYANALAVTQEGQAYQIEDVMIDEKADVAVIKAPTGERDEPVPELYFGRNPDVGDKLELFAMTIRKRGEQTEYAIISQEGVVVRDEDIPPVYHREGQIPVRGMIPAGGFSGGPVTGSYGQIYGVETGRFADRPLTKLNRSDYRGALIAPMSALINLVKGRCS